MPEVEINNSEINSETLDEETPIQVETNNWESATENLNDVEFTNMYKEAFLEKYAGKMSLKNDLIVTIHDTKSELETLKINNLPFEEKNDRIEQIDKSISDCSEKLSELESDISITIDKQQIDTLKLEINDCIKENEKLKGEIKDIEILKDFSLFIENFDDNKFSTWESIYNDEKARELIFKLLEFDGIQVEGIGWGNDLENLINQYKSQKWIQSENIKEIYISLTDNFYRNSLKNYTKNIYFMSPFRRSNWESEDKTAIIKEKAFLCLEWLDHIGTLEESELQEKYSRIYSKNLNDLWFTNIDDLKNDRWLDTANALEYVRKYWEQATESNQTHWNIYVNKLEEKYGSNGNVYAPWAYEKLLPKEKEYVDKVGYSLSIDEYNKLFCNLFRNSQGNIWNCYLISSIRSLARAPYFDTLIRTSIRHNNDNSYTVRLPLWEVKWEDITIYQDELQAASWNGSEWYMLLELAYVKYLNWFPPEHKITREDIEETEAWTSSIAYGVLLWNEWYKVKQYPKNLGLRRGPVIEELKNFNPGMGDTITVSRWLWLGIKAKEDNSVLWTGGISIENVKDEMMKFHVYSLVDVKKNEEWDVVGVVLENPHKNHEIFELSLDEFFSVGSLIECGHITDNFIDTETSRWYEVNALNDKFEHHVNSIFKVPLNHISDYFNAHWWPWNTFKSFFTTKQARKDLWEWIKDTCSNTVEHGMYAFYYWKETAKKALHETKEIVVEKLDSAGKTLKKTWKKIWKAFRDAWDYITDW